MRYLLCGDPDDRKLVSALERGLPPGSSLEVIAPASFARSWRKKAPGAFVWLDASCLDEGRVLELGERLWSLEACLWGVADRKGAIADPAALFFAGGADYLGPALFRSPLPPGRLQAALAHAGLGGAGAAVEEAYPPFPGWSALARDEEVQVRFCYAALSGQKELRERIGEKRLDKLREDFASFLGPWSAECGGIVWIKETAGCLVLFPPDDEGMNPVLAAFRLILDRAIVGYEVFHLEIPLSFHFAFHAGKTMWRPPGATGTVVSDDVNFVFHLGTKATADGEILVSNSANHSIPEYLRDLFVEQGDFEGRPFAASRRFKD